MQKLRWTKRQLASCRFGVVFSSTSSHAYHDYYKQRPLYYPWLDCLLVLINVLSNWENQPFFHESLPASSTFCRSNLSAAYGMIESLYFSIAVCWECPNDSKTSRSSVQNQIYTASVREFCRLSPLRFPWFQPIKHSLQVGMCSGVLQINSWNFGQLCNSQQLNW